MRIEGKVSKVAICEKCNGVILASHLDYIDSETEKEFTELTNEGFTVKLESIDETTARKFATYKDCKKGICEGKTSNDASASTTPDVSKSLLTFCKWLHDQDFTDNATIPETWVNDFLVSNAYFK